jgi:predicted restriction endonuclease
MVTDKLEKYLDNLANSNEKKLDKQFLYSWKYFNYPNKLVFIADIELFLQTIYKNIKLVDSNSLIRLSQQEFRSQLLKQYKCCVITFNSNLDELEASHIKEVKDLGDYSVSNGLILEANLHKTFDKYQWVINPNTLIIEVAKKINSASINKYIGKKVNIQLNPILYLNLLFRYEKFLEINNIN